MKEINLEVKVGTTAIPSNVVDSLANGKPTVGLSLTHEGDFGFTATLSINIGAENKDKYGNLYWYDSDGKLKFMNAGKIAADGTVELKFSHASDYLIVIGENMTPAATSPKTGDEDMTFLWLTLLFGLGTIVVARKKSIVES